MVILDLLFWQGCDQPKRSGDDAYQAAGTIPSIRPCPAMCISEEKPLLSLSPDKEVDRVFIIVLVMALASAHIRLANVARR